MQNRFFSNTMTISYKELINAAKKGDSAKIDFILEAKSNGCILDINNEKEKLKENALEILLNKKDFINASKLLKAGAKTGYDEQVWDHDDRYGGYITEHTDFFKLFSDKKEIFEFLKKEAPEKYYQSKYYADSYKEAKQSYENAVLKYEEAIKRLETCENKLKEFDADKNAPEFARMKY